MGELPESDSVGFSLCGLTARAAMSVPVDRHPYLPKGVRISPYLPKGVRITQKQQALATERKGRFSVV